jgi:hypothetical protein
VAGAGRSGLRRFAVLDAALVSQVATFLGLLLALGVVLVLVHLFLDVTGTFFDLAFDANVRSPLCLEITKRLMQRSQPSAPEPFDYFCGLRVWRQGWRAEIQANHADQDGAGIYPGNRFK